MSETLFRLAAGESGSADTVRDPRGFAVKFYTEEGNWDLTGNNTPIFFIKDALLVSGCVNEFTFLLDVDQRFLTGAFNSLPLSLSCSIWMDR